MFYKKYLIVCLAWLFLCKISMGQKKTDGYVYSEKDVIISTVQHFDTLYCFYNLKRILLSSRTAFLIIKLNCIIGLTHLTYLKKLSAEENLPRTC